MGVCAVIQFGNSLNLQTSTLEPPELVFRGLRVRMGVHAGVHLDSDITFDRTENRTHYSGDTITVGWA